MDRLAGYRGFVNGGHLDAVPIRGVSSRVYSRVHKPSYISYRDEQNSQEREIYVFTISSRKQTHRRETE